MGQNHSHGAKNLLLAFVLNLLFAVAEIIGGVLINSMAVISDAFHDFGDALALGTAYFLEKKAQKPGNNKFTFGYKRFSLLGAIINALILINGSVFILIEAVPRIFEPEQVHSAGMLYFAIAGIAVNGFAVIKMHGGKTMNEKLVSWHLLEDVMGWVVVLLTAVVLMYTDYYFLDPLLSVLITIFILFNVVRNGYKTIYLFLQGVPESLQIEEIKKALLKINGVCSVHHLHIWSEDGDSHVMSVHVVVLNNVSNNEHIKIKKEIKEYCRKLNITHATIELEYQKEDCFMS